MSPTENTSPTDYTGTHRKTRRWTLRRTTKPNTTKPTRPGRTVRATRWTAHDIRALGVTTDLQTAAAILGLQPMSAYPINARGAFPVPVVKVGARYRVPVAPILDLLGLARWPAQS